MLTYYVQGAGAYVQFPALQTKNENKKNPALLEGPLTSATPEAGGRRVSEDE
jgi:hypothetical protein